MTNYNIQDYYFIRPKKKYNSSNRVNKSSYSHSKRDNSNKKLVIAKLKRENRDLKKRISNKKEEKALIIRNKSYLDSKDHYEDLIDLLVESANKEVERDSKDLVIKSLTLSSKERVL